ncbi:hypothetical protein MKK84_02370 [Methylobacterium sp. E-065]|uniref:hypothetical protein n=1 Tax=Methylobacterium sp. E-065 TaxID=2836583 RepID=UPI001FB9BA6B|nr:hypothetical protein [Methylobacterium sp. E-065]MCJ2016280.1 hypothetical protein [Methylobacterium sp. E-065]
MIEGVALPLRFLHARWHSAATMPIRPEHRFSYPIDWAQLSVALYNSPSYFTILQPQLELA